MSRGIITIYLVFILKTLIAQSNTDSLSILLDEVTIETTHEKQYFPKYNSYNINHIAANQNTFGNMGLALQNYTPANIQFYGLSNASISVRGANDDHTITLWNGVPINSLSLGSMDIALITNQASTNIQLITNSGSNNYAAGSFGGILLLEHNFKDTITTTSLATSLASFNHYKVQFNQIIVRNKFKQNITAFYEQAKNNFHFKNIYQLYQPIDTIQHNALQQYGFVQNLEVPLKKNHALQFGTWIQNKYKELPNTMTNILPSQKHQQDFTIKNYVQCKGNFTTRTNYHFTTAHLYDYLLYEDKNLMIDTTLNLQTTYKTNRWFNNLNVNHAFNNKMNIDATFQLQYNHANIKTYAEPKQIWNASFFLGWNYQIKKLKLQSSVRQEIRNAKYILPLWSASLNYYTKNYIIGIAYADKYHAPDFNDLYWAVGGNENLLPERGFTLEWFQQYQKEWTKLMLQIKNSVYYNKIKNNIIWIPFNASIWTPQNIQQTHYYGNEFSLQALTKFNHQQISIWLNYNFNQAIILKNSLQPDIMHNSIPYKPMHTFKVDVHYQTSNFTIGWNAIFTSKRYTTTSNDEFLALPKYTLYNIYLVYDYKFKQSALSFQVSINNLFNVDYQSVRNYAQPKRNLNLLIQYKIFKNGKN